VAEPQTTLFAHLAHRMRMMWMDGRGPSKGVVAASTARLPAMLAFMRILPCEDEQEWTSRVTACLEPRRQRPNSGRIGLKPTIQV